MPGLAVKFDAGGIGFDYRMAMGIPDYWIKMIKEVISTGGSSLKAVEAIRQAGCEVVGMVAMFSYGFPIAQEAFKNAGVELLTLSNYNAMLEAALATNYIRQEDIETLREWRKDPSVWGPKKA